MRGTIFFFGACTVYGLYVEDKYTIPSLVQEHINSLGKKYRVVNLGNDCMTDADNLVESINISENDIVVILFPSITDSIKKSIPVVEVGGRFNELRKEKYRNAECFLNITQHCATNGNIIYSEIIFDEVKKYLVDAEVYFHIEKNIYGIFKKILEI